MKETSKIDTIEVKAKGLDGAERNLSLGVNVSLQSACELHVRVESKERIGELSEGLSGFTKSVACVEKNTNTWETRRVPVMGKCIGYLSTTDPGTGKWTRKAM